MDHPFLNTTGLVGQSRRGNLTQTQPFIENPFKSSQTPQLCQSPSCPTPTDSVPPTSPRSSTGSATRGSLGKLSTREELEKLFPETLLKKGPPSPQLETSWEGTMTWAGSTRRCREEVDDAWVLCTPSLGCWGKQRPSAGLAAVFQLKSPFAFFGLALAAGSRGF